jgi:addiction module HigA family antidote
LGDGSLGEGKAMKMPRLQPIHPGEILREEFMEPWGLNPHKLAMELHVPAPRVYEIIREKRAITSEMAMRIARCFNTTPEFWLNLQVAYDLAVTRHKEQAKITREVHPIIGRRQNHETS